MVVIDNIDNIEDLFSTIKEYDDSYYFRGQSDASWKLESSYIRSENLYKKLNGDSNGNHIAQIFGFKIQDLIQKAEQFLPFHTDDFPSNGDRWSKLAFMQHYGLPTPLLDITQSPYVALYFATDYSGTAERSAIYAINTKKIINQNKMNLSQKFNHKNNPSEALQEAAKKHFSIEYQFDAAEELEIPLIIPVIPKHINLRLFSQQGFFLLSNQFMMNYSIEDLFNEISLEKTYDGLIKKIVFPSKLRKELHRRLFKMGIRPSSLFPSIEGVITEIKQKALLGKGTMYL